MWPTLQEVRAQYQITHGFPPNPNWFLAIVPQLFNAALKLCSRYGVIAAW